MKIESPSSITSREASIRLEWDLPKVISMIENPYNISTEAFSDNTFYNVTLYVPAGTIKKYKTKEGWKKIAFVEERN